MIRPQRVRVDTATRTVLWRCGVGESRRCVQARLSLLLQPVFLDCFAGVESTMPQGSSAGQFNFVETCLATRVNDMGGCSVLARIPQSP